MDSDSPSPTRPPTRDLSDLVVPHRPAGISYEQGEDFDAEALLTANGYSLETQELIALLGSDLAIFQAAAARTLGAKGEQSAIQNLSRLAMNKAFEETARAQAAYALARLGVPDGIVLLVQLIQLNPEGTPAPLQAACALARLGDPVGFPVVSRALDSPSSLTAMIACKQLYAFAEHEGCPLPGNETVKVYEAFRRTLNRPEKNIVGEAMAQLSGIGTEEARRLLSGAPESS